MDGLKALDYALQLSADNRERLELDHSPGHTGAGLRYCICLPIIAKGSSSTTRPATQGAAGYVRSAAHAG